MVRTPPAGRQFPQRDPVRQAAVRERLIADSTPVAVSLAVPRHLLPAFRSIVDEMSDVVVTRIEASRQFKQEAALTQAAAALGILRASVHAAAPAGSPDWK